MLAHLEEEKEGQKKALKQAGLHGYGFPEPSDSLLAIRHSGRGSREQIKQRLE